jgi:PAS domain S-box-containing protein
VALVLGLTVAGFIVARALTERDARRDSEQRVQIAAAQIRSRVEVATSVTESLRRFVFDEGATGVTNDQFTKNVLRWLSPVDLPAAAWAEEVRAADRAAYERRIGRPIVSPDERRKAVPPGSSYLAATLVSGFPPMDSRGVDLRREPGIAAALGRATRPGGVGATPVGARKDGTRGLFLVAPAPNLIDGALRPGAVVVVLSEATLRAAARNPAGLRFLPADRSSGDRTGGDTVRAEFTVAGQPFAVLMPKESVSGPGAVLPWIILAAGLVLAGLMLALGSNAARRARAQEDLDRIFMLSPDMITVADFEGRFTRVNPAVERILGYTEEESLSRSYLDFVHPDDRERTVSEAAAITEGQPTLSFENRYMAKDGSYRTLEWTTVPVVAQRLMYGVARDVTERRRAETEVERLADEQAALRRVATLVAEESSPAEVFAKVAEELANVLDDVESSLFRDEGDGTASAVALWGPNISAVRPGTRIPADGDGVIASVLREGTTCLIGDYSATTGAIAERDREPGIRSAIGCPIVVRGRIWGAMGAARYVAEAFPPEAETRITRFADLVATAIGNAEARTEVERLAAEQAALRRVATLVAEGAPATAVFDAVSAEMEALLEADGVILSRYEREAEITIMASRGPEDKVPVGLRTDHQGESVTTEVRRTGRPARMKDYGGTRGDIADLVEETGLRAAVGAPVVVDGRLWGVIMAYWRGEEDSPPSDTEARMTQFAQLLETSIANADSREQLKASRARVIAAGDEARRRVVRDLHDGAQQRLVHTVIVLKQAARALAKDDDKVESLVAEAIAQSTKANAALRELAQGIMPAVLTRGGVAAGVHSLVSRSPVPVDVTVSDQRFPADVEATAYFVVAEALTNVAKHSLARSAEVCASVDDGVLRIDVRDDGVGGADPEGGGLLGLADRIAALDGELKLESPPGAGTRVTATIPLPD